MSLIEKYGHVFKIEEVIHPNSTVFELFTRKYKRKYILFGPNIACWKEEKPFEIIFGGSRPMFIPKPLKTMDEAYKLIDSRYKPTERREITEAEILLSNIK